MEIQPKSRDGPARSSDGPAKSRDMISLFVSAEKSKNNHRMVESILFKGKSSLAFLLKVFYVELDGPCALPVGVGSSRLLDTALEIAL